MHRFNTAGPDGLVDQWSPDPLSRLSPEQQSELAAMVETGPDRAVDGVVRWRRIDLKRSSRSASAWTTTRAMS
ncbi:MAG: helix-turn-helix domain-containing protein [Mesorhizobium sp.]|nr:helix-turn-helix domain-containing protein [Mesorhizobium sp. M00.F.Ca.ET.158.01.1.1]TKB39533.1 MAG: helix-turn-helix domain-containing protein [Mesorhizobium sp.]